MPCSDQFCEDTLTFYRKTRAAGAVALFTKAFVEAGNSKLVKFFLFRLWKNSLQKNQQQQNKMKNIVQRLFGSNVVFLPFAAWKKYTKENIMERKNRFLAQYKEKNELLESQVLKTAATCALQEAEIKSLRADLAKYKAEKETATNLISSLQSQLKTERNRVVRMSSLLQPLAEHWKLTDKFVATLSQQVRAMLLNNGMGLSSYDYSHIFNEEFVEAFQRMVVSDFNAIENENRRAHMKRMADQTMSGQILLEWINAESLKAEGHLDMFTGDALGKYLPAHEKQSTLSDLSNGKALCRAVVGIIYEKTKEYEHHMMAPMRVHKGRNIRQISFCGPPVPLSRLELDTIRAVQNNPYDLITVTLKLATERLQMPPFKSTDIFAGRTDVLLSLCVALMVVSVPSLNDEDAAAIDSQINAFQQTMLISDRGNEEGDTDGNFYFDCIDKIDSLQEHFDMEPEEESTNLYPALSKNREFAHTVMSTLMTVTKSDFQLLDMGDVNTTVIASEPSQQSAEYSTRTSVIRSSVSNASVYEQLAAQVDSLVARASANSQPLKRAVRSRAMVMEQLLQIEKDSIHLRELRDDGMRLTTNIRKFVIQTFINQTVP